MAKINYFMGTGWLPEEYEAAMPRELKALGLDISAKKVPYDDMDKDAEVVILHGEGAYRYFARNRDRENKTYRLRNKKVVVFVWDIPTHRFKNDSWARWFKTNTMKFLKPHLVICPSKFTQLELKRNGIKSEVQLSYFNDQIITDKPVEKINQIISVGRIAPEKNHIVILYALSILPQEWTYLIITPVGQLSKAVLEVAQNFNLKVEIRENIPPTDVMKEIKRSRLLVSPSIFEGFGLPPKEAVWAGTPAIVSTIPPFKEFHGNTLPMVDPFDFISLSDRIWKIWKHGFNLTRAKKKIMPLTVHNQAIKFIDYLERHTLKR